MNALYPVQTFARCSLDASATMYIGAVRQALAVGISPDEVAERIAEMILSAGDIAILAPERFLP